MLAVGWLTLHGGPVRLRPVRATFCFRLFSVSFPHKIVVSVLVSVVKIVLHVGDCRGYVGGLHTLNTLIGTVCECEMIDCEL